MLAHPTFHLSLATLIAAICLWLCAGECRGKPFRVGRVLLLPVLAVITLALLLPRHPLALHSFWTVDAMTMVAAGSLVGLLAGIAHALATKVRADHVWGVVYIGRRRTALVVALLLFFAVGLQIADKFLGDGGLLWAIAIVGAGSCTSFLLGRALTVLLRYWRAPHTDLITGL